MDGIHPDTNEGLVRGCACRGAAGFAHVSCLARQAQVAVKDAEERYFEDAEERDLHNNSRWTRWHTCGLCKQEYHGVVRCALGWACWNTYVGRPEGETAPMLAMNVLGNGLCDDASSVREAELAMLQRIGALAEHILGVQGNLASTYEALGRAEEAMRMRRDVYLGFLKLNGEENRNTRVAANNYACMLMSLNRFEEAKALLRKAMPVAQRVLGKSDDATLTMRSVYAEACYKDPSATAGDLRKTINMLEDTERIARRVLGGAHPTVVGIEWDLRSARADTTQARETPPRGA